MQTSIRLICLSIILLFCSACATQKPAQPAATTTLPTLAPSSTSLPPTEPPATPTPDPTAPFEVDGVKLQFSLVSMTGKLGEGGMMLIPAGAAPDAKIIAIGVNILDVSDTELFDLQSKVGKWKVWLTDETGEKYTNTAALSSHGANNAYHVAWLIVRPSDPKSLTLHFPSGEELNLEHWMD